jgi:Zn-finger nucleic acid-binding protein
VDDAVPLPCPRCRTDLTAIKIGATDLRECARCHGLWAETACVEQVCADREKQAAILGMPSSIEPAVSGAIEEKVRYMPCPQCRKLMHRINFARFSNVIVDVCKGHGTWFDRDELRRIVEFIRAGGLDSARAREIDELEQRRRQINAAQYGPQAWDTRLGAESGTFSDLDSGFSIAASLLKSFLR